MSSTLAVNNSVTAAATNCDVAKPVQSKSIMTALFEGAVTVAKFSLDNVSQVLTMGTVAPFADLQKKAREEAAIKDWHDLSDINYDQVEVPEVPVKESTIWKAAKIAVAVLLVGVAGVACYTAATSVIAKKVAVAALSVLTAAVKRLPFVNAA